jgi:hypothetical protein
VAVTIVAEAATVVDRRPIMCCYTAPVYGRSESGADDFPDPSVTV